MFVVRLAQVAAANLGKDKLRNFWLVTHSLTKSMDVTVVQEQFLLLA